MRVSGFVACSFAPVFGVGLSVELVPVLPISFSNSKYKVLGKSGSLATGGCDMS